MLNKRELTFADFSAIQNELNSKAIEGKPDWESHLSPEDFLFAAFCEGAEYGDTTPWKWWKKYTGEAREVDYWNLKIEAIDILFFLTSAIRLNGNATGDEDTILGIKAGEEQLINLLRYDEEKDLTRVDTKVFMEVFRRLMAPTCGVEDLNLFLVAAGIKSEEVSPIYVAKYALNKIRWASHEYGANYKKMIAGLEDNQHLKSIVDDYMANPNKTLKDVHDEVYKKMESL